MSSEFDPHHRLLELANQFADSSTARELREVSIIADREQQRVSDNKNALREVQWQLCHFLGTFNSDRMTALNVRLRDANDLLMNLANVAPVITLLMLDGRGTDLVRFAEIDIGQLPIVQAVPSEQTPTHTGKPSTRPPRRINLYQFQFNNDTTSVGIDQLPNKLNELDDVAKSLTSELRRRLRQAEEAVLRSENGADGSQTSFDARRAKLRGEWQEIEDLIKETRPDLWTLLPIVPSGELEKHLSRQGFLQKMRHIVGNLTTLKRDGGVSEPTQSPEDGLDGGRWLWVNGERYKVPTGRVYRLLAFMWNRESATFEQLYTEIFDDPVSTNTIRSLANKVNNAISGKGIPWKLSFDGKSNHVVKKQA